MKSEREHLSEKYHLSLRISQVQKFKMASIFHFWFVVKKHLHIMRTECHNEHSAENQILRSLFANEIYPIIENSKWLPSGHLEFFINMDFS